MMFLISWFDFRVAKRVGLSGQEVAAAEKASESTVDDDGQRSPESKASDLQDEQAPSTASGLFTGQSVRAI